MTDEDVKSLHIYARELVDQLKNAGVVFDKKQLRFNDIVEVGLHYAACGVVFDIDVAKAGVQEAVHACIIGDAQHIPKSSVRTMTHNWMEWCAR